MKKIKIGVIGPSEIAYRRFMPALEKSDKFEYVGISIASKSEWDEKGSLSSAQFEIIMKNEYEKAKLFEINYGGEIFNSYLELIQSDEIEAIYLPLPPALHYKWASVALSYGKHVFIEKPATLSATETKRLIDLSTENNLAIHENYMFVFHSQIDYLKSLMERSEVGEIQKINIAFGFPFRGYSDFRYNKKLGGGALFDCGGYTVKLINLLMGSNVELISAVLKIDINTDVDIMGNLVYKSDRVIGQCTFGMNHSYKCDIEIWGSKGAIFTNRIFTAPIGYRPQFEVNKDGVVTKIDLSDDDTFFKSLEHFYSCIIDENTRKISSSLIMRQAEMIDEILEKRLLI